MGVMECGRADCEKFLCNRLILEGTTYICDRCWGELLEEKETWPEAMTEVELRGRIEDFMQTSPGSRQPLSGIDLEEAFRRLTCKD